jgi:hypothetical protein
LNKISELQTKFIEAMHVVMTGKESSDISANARIFEIALAEPYVNKNTLLGSGLLSNQWQGGFQDRLGYFHPSDIGIYGVIFAYGILGLLLFSFQFYFAWRYSNSSLFKGKQYIHLSDAMIGLLVFHAFYSITTGVFAFSFEQGLMMTAVLYCTNQENRLQQKGFAD